MSSFHTYVCAGIITLTATKDHLSAQNSRNESDNAHSGLPSNASPFSSSSFLFWASVTQKEMEGDGCYKKPTDVPVRIGEIENEVCWIQLGLNPWPSDYHWATRLTWEEWKHMLEYSICLSPSRSWLDWSFQVAGPRSSSNFGTCALMTEHAIRVSAVHMV